MQSTSQLYKTILAGTHAKEWRVKIDNTIYGKSSIVSVRRNSFLYGENLIGGACSGSMELVLLGVASDDVPEMARIELSVRLVSDLGTSEFLPMGTYWINRRKDDQKDGTLALECVDGMMFGEQDFYPVGSEITGWTNKTMREVAQMCATKMGIPLENATQFHDAEPYILTAPPIGYSVRQVLAGIAAAHGGNIIVTKENKLRLVPFVPTDSGVDLEQNVASMETGKQYASFGNVIFNFESTDGGTLSVRYPTTEAFGATMEAPLLAVTDSGYALEIAQNVLSSLGSYQYAPYKAKDALLDPAMEMGDGLTVNGLYSVIAEADEICDELYSASIGAESYEETKSEFIFKPSAERTIERKIAQSSASLKIDIDGIKAMVSGLAAPWEAGHSYSVGDIVENDGKFYRCTVANSDSTFNPSKWTEIDSGVVESILQLAIGKMTLSVSGDGSGSSIVLTSGSVRITSAATYFDTNEAHFSGSLSANKISAGSIDAEVVSVKTAFAVQMLVNNVWTTVGYVGAATGIDASGNTTRGAVLKSVDGDSYVIATNAGVRMQQGDTGLWIADNAISYRINGGAVTPLGYAVFS